MTSAHTTTAAPTANRRASFEAPRSRLRGPAALFLTSALEPLLNAKEIIGFELLTDGGPAPGCNKRATRPKPVPHGPLSAGGRRHLAAHSKIGVENKIG